MDYIVYLIFRSAVLKVSLMSTRGMAWTSSILRFMLQRVFCYRNRVIRANISHAFPDMSKSETRQFIDDYYQHLAQLIISSIRSYSYTAEEVLRIFQIPDMSLADGLAAAGKPSLFLGSHLGTWELAALAVGLYFKQPVIIVYKPLSNKYLNRYLISTRSKFNIKMVSMSGLSEVIRQKLHLNPAIIMLADQYPMIKSAQEIPFLNLPTLWFNGADTLSKRYDLIPFFFEVKSNGFDEHITLFQSLERDRLMTEFVQKFENSLHMNKVQWLWSHHRWKNIPHFYESTTSDQLKS